MRSFSVDSGAGGVALAEVGPQVHAAERHRRPPVHGRRLPRASLGWAGLAPPAGFRSAT